MLVYKVVETSIVTEESLERILNQWVTQGWEFDRIQFVIRDASKRPSMAFLFFVKKEDG
jgi:tRNA1(Val) A37 N6-methylase TrmN6